jgi:hypothetical protein
VPPGGHQRRAAAQTIICRETLLASEIHGRIQRHFPEDVVPTVTDVRTALKDGSEFVQPERDRWHFGRAAGPWQSGD